MAGRKGLEVQFELGKKHGARSPRTSLAIDRPRAAMADAALH